MAIMKNPQLVDQKMLDDLVAGKVREPVLPITSPEIAAHEPKFLPNAWLTYTVPQLGHAIDFNLAKSRNLADKAAARKKVASARIYASMILAHIDAREKELPA